MSFFSQLSHGGMARMKGFGGPSRNLVPDISLTINGSAYTFGLSNVDITSETSNIVVTGGSGGEALIRLRLESNNGYSVGEFVIRVGDTFTYQRYSANRSYATSMCTGQVPNSMPSYSPRMFMMAGIRAPDGCQSGGSAGYPQGGRGNGGGSCGNQQGWGGGGGACGGTTWGYQSGQGGQHGQFYSGPGGNGYNGGFLSYGSGGNFWFAEFRGNSPGGYGYYGGGGGGGGWTGGRGQGCSGGGGGGSNYIGGLPSGNAPGYHGNNLSLQNTSSGSSNTSSYMRIEWMQPV